MINDGTKMKGLKSISLTDIHIYVKFMLEGLLYHLHWLSNKNILPGNKITRKSSCGKPQEAYHPRHKLSKHILSWRMYLPWWGDLPWATPHPDLAWGCLPWTGEEGYLPWLGYPLPQGWTDRHLWKQYLQVVLRMRAVKICFRKSQFRQMVMVHGATQNSKTVGRLRPWININPSLTGIAVEQPRFPV